jgi:hypothetical protein
VLRSDVFKNSDSLRHLLTYLAEMSFAKPGEDVKEYTIGIEACGKPASYDPQKDASVRVQVGRLRQKLEEYYASEGASDQLTMELPKGRFVILFHSRAAAASPKTGPLRRARSAARRLRSIPLLTLALVALLVACAVWAAVLSIRMREYQAQTETVRQFSDLWAPFFSHSVPTVAVFGSPPFLASPSQAMFVRFYDSKNPDDPRSSPHFPDIDAKIGPLAGPRFDYASMGDAMAVQRLTAFFGSAGIPLKASPAHLVNWDSVRDGNLILIGAGRMHPLLRRLPVAQDFELGSDEQIHNRNRQPGEPEMYRTPSHRDTMTYAVVAAYPGLAPGREVLVITAHSSAGAMAAVDFITGRGGVGVMKEKIGLSGAAPRRYFQMLLRIYVDNDLPIKTEYATHHLSR